MTAALVKELRYGLFVNALNGPLDPRESDHVGGHVFQWNPGITRNASETVPRGLGPKAFNHTGILPALDVRPGKFRSRRSDIRRLHLCVIVGEARDIAHWTSPTSSQERSQVMDEIGEDAIRHDGVLLEIGGTKIDG